MIAATRSRVSRYASAETIRKASDAIPSTGKMRNVSRASSASSTMRMTAVPMSVSVEPNSVTTPSLTSWSSACTSFVSREMMRARLAARVEAHRQRLQVREEGDPQVLQRPLADPADEVGLA